MFPSSKRGVSEKCCVFFTMLLKVNDNKWSEPSESFINAKVKQKQKYIQPKRYMNGPETRYVCALLWKRYITYDVSLNQAALM